MKRNTLIIYPDGTVQATHTDTPAATAARFCGGYATRQPEPFHGLEHFEVWMLDDMTGEPVNLPASRMVGMDLSQCAPMRGPVIVTRLPEGETTTAEREHQTRFFGLDAPVNRPVDERDIEELLRYAPAAEFESEEAALGRSEMTSAPQSFMDAMMKALFQVQSGEADIVAVDWPDAG